jgi:hypothetical protein
MPTAGTVSCWGNSSAGSRRACDSTTSRFDAFIGDKAFVDFSGKKIPTTGPTTGLVREAKRHARDDGTIIGCRDPWPVDGAGRTAIDRTAINGRTIRGPAIWTDGSSATIRPRTAAAPLGPCA